MPSSCGIAIVGGGLAGLAAAHALRTFGMQPEVFEAAAALGEIGAAVNVSPQAFKALQAIDLGDKVAAVANSSPGIYTRNMQTGEKLGFRDARAATLRYGSPYYSLQRADLLNVLAETGPDTHGLTPREREVLSLLCHGLSNKRIAGELGLSEKTIKAHVGHIFGKLGVTDRTQAAMIAFREGLSEC